MLDNAVIVVHNSNKKTWLVVFQRIPIPANQMSTEMAEYSTRVFA
jgi:hypothetical protein